MPALRADAARSRARILDAARSLPPGAIRLNDLARETGLGVGTVYRHFPTVTSLLEALNVDALRELVELARTAADTASSPSAFADLVRAGTEVQVSRPGLQTVLLTDDASAEVRALREEFLRLAAVALDAAVRAGHIRADVSIEQIQRLVCGTEHAIRLGGGGDRALLLDVVVAGLRPPG